MRGKAQRGKGTKGNAMQAQGTRHKALVECEERHRGTKPQREKTIAFSANGAAPYQPGATPQEPESEEKRCIGCRVWGKSPIRFWRRPCLSVEVRVCPCAFPVAASHRHRGEKPSLSAPPARHHTSLGQRPRNRSPKKTDIAAPEFNIVAVFRTYP